MKHEVDLDALGFESCLTITIECPYPCASGDAGYWVVSEGLLERQYAKSKHFWTRRVDERAQNCGSLWCGMQE